MAQKHGPYDIFIIGGGINGTGIARDAAGRGYSVGLAEMGDLASGTSSKSSKLIHGGLRYLEHYEFRLVREALKEREILWAIAPHIIWPVRIILPHHRELRPFWLLRLGLLIYDYIGGRKRLPPAKTLDLTKDPVGKPLKSEFVRAFEYSDCAVLDSRLVVLNALDASAMSANIMPRTKVIRAECQDGVWQIETENTRTGHRQSHQARLLVNAAGPWIDKVLGQSLGQDDATNVRIVRGSHIIVKRLYGHDRDYIFQNADQRIIFVVPYEDQYTLIGTTDLDHKGDVGNVEIDDSEIDYLCAAASEYFDQPVRRDQVVGSYSGLRSLYDDGASKAQEATRDYVLKQDGGRNQDQDTPALINVFGGKITTYRQLALSVLDLINQEFQRDPEPWTASKPLPGGDFEIDEFDALITKLRVEYPFLSEEHSARLVRYYGLIAWKILSGCDNQQALGLHFGADLYECEVRYLVEMEWAQTADDILSRRTNLWLHVSAAQKATLAEFLDKMPDREHIIFNGNY